MQTGTYLLVYLLGTSAILVRSLTKCKQRHMIPWCVYIYWNKILWNSFISKTYKTSAITIRGNH